MQAILDSRIFTARVFDSGALGVLASVLHQFTETGRYQAIVSQHGAVQRSIFFEVTDDSPNMQLDFDLSASGNAASSDHDDCECRSPTGAQRRSSDDDSLPSVSPKGYALFFGSRGTGGYSVVVHRESKKEIAFDSKTLSEGDLFVLTLLAPTEYVMTNRMSKSKGAIVVTTDAERSRNLPHLPAVYIEVSQRGFVPEKVEVVSGQGIIFRVSERARIVVEQTKEPHDHEPLPRRRFTLSPSLKPRKPRSK